MARWPISGEPGKRWRNDTGKVLYQLVVNWHNSCIRCIQFDHMIARKWPIPFHRSCMCRQVPIDPGGVSRPFVDFRRKIARLSKVQRGRIAGKAILRLVEARVIRWEDVATPDRVRGIEEVVARKRLSVEAMVNNGVSRPVAERAHARAGHHAALRRAAIARLEGDMHANEERRRATSDRLGGNPR